MVTARIRTLRDRSRDARAALADVLQKLDDEYPGTPEGLAITVAWGLPYFNTHVPRPRRRTFRSTSGPGSRPCSTRCASRAIRRTPCSRTTTSRSSSAATIRDHIQKAATEIFDRMKGVLAVTSIRKGFAGQLDGGPGLPKEMATAAGVPGAELIPDGAELFLGFTSTQRHALGPPRIVNFETLGLVELGPRSYFRGGTHMHLSHVFEDLEAWYLNFDFRERVNTTFKPRMPVKEGTQTVPQPPSRASSTNEVERRLPSVRRDRPQLVAAAGVTSPARRPRPPTARSTARERRSRSARISTRSTTRSSGARRPTGTGWPTAPPPGCTSSSSIRRATTSTATGLPWTASCRAGRSFRSRRGTGGRASTRSCRPRTARTSWCLRAGTGHFLWRSFK